MPAWVLLFVVIICAINALALLFFTVRAMRRQLLYRVIFRDGTTSDWSRHKHLTMARANTWPDAIAVENQFGERVMPRRSAPGGFPASK